MKKNQIIDLEITDLSYEAMGVAHYEGMTVFVTNALPGEVVSAKILKVKKNFAFAKIEEIKKHSPKAIVITSPSYEGIVPDINAISRICKKYNVYLIVDEAHGALYPFSDNLPQSAIPYADFTVQSLHKTAGGINPTALLHTNSDLDPLNALNMINTTSPSYPMLATIEANINYLKSKKGKQNIEFLIEQINEIKNSLKNIEFYGDDPTKILIKKEGMSGYGLSELLFEKFYIEDERTNDKSTLLLTGLGTSKAKLDRLKKVLLKIDKM